MIFRLQLKTNQQENEKLKIQKAMIQNALSYLQANVRSALFLFIVTTLTLVDSLRGFIGERRGERVDMQDAHVILDNLLPFFSTQPKE